MPSSPTTVTTPHEARAACEAARARGARVGLVPTMGALHEGHLALVREARRHADFVVVSIFVNPTQFGPNEDFARYPRDLEADVVKLGQASLVFAPQVAAMYPPGDQTRVRAGSLADPLCGPHRPGHFEGVATIVTKLFAIAGPCAAVFGKKDYQQLIVIRGMVRQLDLPVEIVAGETVREPDGLAMSSRNNYLSPAERAEAPRLARTLTQVRDRIRTGERTFSTLCESAMRELAAAGWRPDYVEVRRQRDLAQPAPGDRDLVALAAARLGNTRLIDNLEITS